MTRLATFACLYVINVIRYAGLIALLLAVLPQCVTAQRVGAGTTLPGNQPGAPAGSYALSGFDTVNLYNGNLNFHLPLLQIAGRGTAGHTVMLSIEQRWNMVKLVNEESLPPNFSYGANPNNWAPFRPGYGPGLLIGRAVDFQPDGCPPPGQAFYPPAYSLTRLTFIAPDGTETELRDELNQGAPITHTVCLAHPQTSRGRVFRSADGSAMTFISDLDRDEIKDVNYGLTVHIDPYGYLFMRDGTRYRIEKGLVKWIRDRNGNSIAYTYDEFSRVLRITDSLGRKVEIDYYNPPTQTYDRIRYTGFGASPREIKIYYANMSQLLEPGFSIMTLGGLFPPLDVATGGGVPPPPDPTPHNPIKVSEVRLPDNNRSYQFRYNSHGELARVTLPTGGYIKYDWENGPNTLLGGVLASLRVGSSPYQAMAIYRRVKQSWVYPDGVNLEGSTKYTAEEPGDTVVKVEHLTPISQAPPLSVEKHYFYGKVSYFLVEGIVAYGESQNPVMNPIDYPFWLEGREYKTQLLASNGTTVLREKIDTWRQRAPLNWFPQVQELAPANDPRLIGTETTLMDSTTLVSKATSCPPSNPTCDPNHSDGVGFDQYNNQTDVWEYDFGGGAPGALLRHTHTDYLITNNGIRYDTVNNTAGQPFDPNPLLSQVPSASLTAHLRSLPLRQVIFNATGTKFSETEYEYDNYAVGDGFHESLGTPDRTNISGPDVPPSTGDTCSGFKACPPSYTTRGNVTAVKRWLDIGQPTSDRYIVTYQQYDIAGNVVKAIDAGRAIGPRGTTVFDYADRFGGPNGEAQSNTPPQELGVSQKTYAFVTKVTNARGQSGYTQYDYYLGRPVDSEDLNGVVSSATYADLLDRPTLALKAANVDDSLNPVKVKGAMQFGYEDSVALRAIVTMSDQDALNDGKLQKQDAL